MYGPLAFKVGEQEARERLRAFWVGSSAGDRPALHVLADSGTSAGDGVGGPGPAPRSDSRTGSAGPDESRKACDLDPAWHIARIDAALASTVYLAEAMPVADIMVGTDVTDTAVLLGGDYDYFHDEAIIRRDGDVLSRPVPAFDASSEFVVALERVYREVAAHVGRHAFVNTTMTLDALTTLSMMQGQTELFRAMMTRPVEVLGHVTSTARLVNAFYAHFYGLVRDLGHGESAGWFHCMAEGRFDVLRSDVSVMLSPEMFEQFVVPELTIRAAALDCSLFNMDSVEMVRFIDALAEVPGVRGVFWNPGPSEGALGEHLEHLARIRERGMLLDVMAADADEAAEVARALGPDGLMIALPRYPDAERAEEAIDVVCAAWR